jgi:acetyl esterase/lipase
LQNIDKYGGDKEKVVVVGQSAGAHLGGIVLMKKVLDKLRRLRLTINKDKDVNGTNESSCTPLTTSYEATDLCGFISTSSPHNLVTMRQVFHRHGLSCSVQNSIFGGEDDGRDALGQDVFEKWSTFHLVKKCHEKFMALTESAGDSSDLTLKNLFPNLCVIHGTNDKTVRFLSQNTADLTSLFISYKLLTPNNPQIPTPSGTSRRIHRIPRTTIPPPNTPST